MTLEELLAAALQAKIEISGAMEGVGAHRRPTELTALEANAIQHLFKQLNGTGFNPESRRGRAVEKLLTDSAPWLTNFVVRTRTSTAEPAVTAPVTVLDEATGEQIPLAEDPEYLDIFGQIPLTPEGRHQIDIMVRAMALDISGYTDSDRITYEHVKMFVDGWMEAYAGAIPAEDWTETQILAFMKATYTENFYDEDERRWDISPESLDDVSVLGLHDAPARNKAIEISSGENLMDAEGNVEPNIYVSKHIVDSSVGLAYEKAGMLQPAARETPPKTADIQEALRKALSKGGVLIDENTGRFKNKDGVDALISVMAERIEIAMYWSDDEELDGMENWELYEAMERFVKTDVAEVRKQGIDVAMTDALEENKTASQLEHGAVSEYIKGINLKPRQVSFMDTPEMRAKIIQAWQSSGSPLEINAWLEQGGEAVVLDELEEARAKAAGEDTVKGRRDIFKSRISGSEDEGGLGINLANEDARNVSDQLLAKAEEAWQLEQDSGGTRSLEEIQDEFIKAMPSQAEIDRRIESRFGALPPGVEEGRTAATARYDAIKARMDAGEEFTNQEILDARDPIQGIADVAMAELGGRIGGAREVTLPEGHMRPDGTKVGPGGQRVWKSTIPERTPEQNEQLMAELTYAQIEGDVAQEKLIQADIDATAKTQAELANDRYVAGALMTDAALATAFATGDKTKLDTAIASAKELYARDLNADVLSEAMTRTVVGAAAPLYDVSRTPGAASKFAVAGAGATGAYLEEQEKQKQQEAQRAAARASQAAADAVQRGRSVRVV